MARDHIESILVATDLGEGSDVIVAAAASLAAHSGAELHLLHSLELPVSPNEDPARHSGIVGDIADAERRLSAQAARVLGGDLTPASEAVAVYTGHLAILDRAQKVAADLIVLGPHRGTSRSALFLGTTADRVLRSGEVPCLIVREQLRFPASRIAVATDFSEAAGEALHRTLAWLSNLTASSNREPDNGGEIRLVHVAHPSILGGDPDLAATIQGQLVRQIEGTLAVHEKVRAVPVLPEILWHPRPGDGLAEWLRNDRTDLLVLGTHGAGFLERALIGSVAISMARFAPCSVLLVPPPPRYGQG